MPHEDEQTRAVLGEGAQLALFHRSLGELVRAEVPLGRALELLQKDLERGRMRDALAAMRSDVDAGMPLEQAYAKQGEVFPPLYAGLIEAGIASGDLAGTLAEIAGHASREADVAARLRRALAYPVVSGVLIIGIGTLLLVYIYPLVGEQFEALFSGMHIELPLITRIGLAFRSPLAGAGLLIAAASALLGIASVYSWLCRPLDGVAERFRFTMRLPVIGTLRLNATLSLVASTLAVLVRRGLPLERALRLTAKASGDPEVSARVLRMADSAAKGSGLADAAREAGLLPPTIVWLIGAAEARGQVEPALTDIAEIYHDRFTRAVDWAIAFARPGLEVALGLLVLMFGFLILGQFVPLFKLVSSIS